MKQKNGIRYVISFLAAWVTIVVSGSLIAMIMAPWIAASFGPSIRDPEVDGLLWPALLAGYAVIASVLVWLMQKIRPASIGAAARFGLFFGLAIFLGDHLIVSGWSTLPAFSMLVSGFLDAFAVSIASIVIYSRSVDL